jgi:hypothetical protein
VEAQVAGIPPFGESLAVLRPAGGSIFPSDALPPSIAWRDNDPRSRCWLVAVEFQSGHPSVYAFAVTRSWTPEPAVWKTIRKHAGEGAARVTVYALSDGESVKVFGKTSIFLLFSPAGVQRVDRRN